MNRFWENQRSSIAVRFEVLTAARTSDIKTTVDVEG
jgi:hypothetical protein